MLHWRQCLTKTCLRLYAFRMVAQKPHREHEQGALYGRHHCMCLVPFMSDIQRCLAIALARFVEHGIRAKLQARP